MSEPATLLIDGAPVAPAGTPRIEPLNPATGEVLWSLPSAGPDEVAAALASAERGLQAWRATPPWERSRVLRRTAQLMAERLEAIAELLTLEIGKPLAESRGEVQNALEHFDWCADEARRIYDYGLPGRSAGSRYEMRHEPVGIVLALTAWNFPVSLAARKVALSLAAGCAVILRPASEAPSSVAAMARCCLDAGLPPGALNLLMGEPGAVVEPLMDAPSVRKVSFTGSTRVGQILMRQAAGTVKKLTLELGGHAPFLVLDDADVGVAARAAVAAKFRNAGQVCTSPSRFYVAERVADDFVAAMVEGAERLVVGPGLEPATQIGPVATLRQRERAERLVADATGRGARLATGGGRTRGRNAGFFLDPTILVDVPDEAAVMSEEPFSPVAAIVRVRDEEEAVARANGLDYALSSYVFGAPDHAMEVAGRIEAGLVGVNTTVVAMPEAPFGGNKQSGFGREGGRDAIADYLTVKMIHQVRLPTRP